MRMPTHVECLIGWLSSVGWHALCTNSDEDTLGYYRHRRSTLALALSINTCSISPSAMADSSLSMVELLVM